MELVAFSAYAQSGKDEAAKALAEIGFVRIAFADKLREFLYLLDPVVDFAYPATPEGSGELVRLRDVIDEFGWDGYKQTHYVDEIRPLLQRLGTECGREVLGENTWVDAALNGLDPDGKYVVTDCRFPNEAQAVKDRGGKIYRIHRPGVGPANNHPSETSLDDWLFDGVIFNDSTVENFHIDVRGFVALCT